MANVFAVTTANESINLDAKRHGEATFTVTDSISRPLRGLAKVKPLGDTKQQWLKLAGESERDFAAGGTQQYTVSIDIPPEVPAGKYGFRLDIVSMINPDEDFTEGPTVNAEVAARKPPPPSRAWIIPVALIVVAAMVGVVVLILTRSKKVKVPAVEGQKVEKAQKDLSDVGLKVDLAKIPSTDPTKVGTVKSAVPKPGDTVDPGSTVTLQVYVPDKVSVAKVLGLKLDKAKEILEGQQFLKVQVDPQPIASLEYKEGEVAKQSLGEGTPADPGSLVTLTLAGATVLVPTGLKDNKLQAAVDSIQHAELNVKAIVGDQLDGNVVNTDPEERTPVLKESKVTIYMPQTPCTTPLCLRLRGSAEYRGLLARPSP